MRHDPAPSALFVRGEGGTRTNFEFKIDPEHVLLAEHFPGFPIAPGSQVLDFLWRQTSRDPAEAATGWVDVRDARFHRPFLPGSRFTCKAVDIVSDTVTRRRIVVSNEAGQPCLQVQMSRPMGSETDFAQELQSPIA